MSVGWVPELGWWFGPPSLVSTMLFLAGWCAGWIGVLQARALPRARQNIQLASRPSVSVIVPCRNEARQVPELLSSLQSALRDDDEVIVIDDDSIDETARIASSHGAVVISAGALPVGWVGKPYACWRGAHVARHEVLLFVDADVRVGSGAVDDVLAVLSEHPTAVVSAMPWHETVGSVEKLSMLFNVVSAMVASTGRRGARRVAYGPFLAVRRDAYLRCGGHSHPSVRGAVVEDLALARAMPVAVATIAAPSQVRYRMYPLGFGQLVEGWTKNTAIGAVNVPRWSATLIIAWIISLCGGPFTSMWCLVLSAGQLAVVSRRFGNFGVVSALLYPLHAAVFVSVAARSLFRSALRGSVSWRGRSIATR